MILLIPTALCFTFLLLCTSEFLLFHLCSFSFIALCSALIPVPLHATVPRAPPVSCPSINRYSFKALPPVLKLSNSFRMRQGASLGELLVPRGPDQADTQQSGFMDWHDIPWELSHFMTISFNWLGLKPPRGASFLFQTNNSNTLRGVNRDALVLNVLMRWVNREAAWPLRLPVFACGSLHLCLSATISPLIPPMFMFPLEKFLNNLDF